MQTKVLYRLLLHDKNGKLLKKTRWRKCHSFLLQYLKHIQVIAQHPYNSAGTTVSVRDINNALKNLQAQSAVYSHQFFSLDAPNAEGNYGIVVGTDSTPPTNEDYALKAKIAQGIGAGQLNHGGHNFTGAVVVGANVDLVISRSFYNGSGGSITIREIGVYVNTKDTAGASCFFCILRDVITEIIVMNTQTLTVQYTLRTTV